MSQLDLFADPDQPWLSWPTIQPDWRWGGSCPKCRKSPMHGGSSGPVRSGETLVGWYHIRGCCRFKYFQPAYTCCTHCSTTSPYHPGGVDSHNTPCGCAQSRQVQP